MTTKMAFEKFLSDPKTLEKWSFLKNQKAGDCLTKEISPHFNDKGLFWNVGVFESLFIEEIMPKLNEYVFHYSPEPAEPIAYFKAFIEELQCIFKKCLDDFDAKQSPRIDSVRHHTPVDETVFSVRAALPNAIVDEADTEQLQAEATKAPKKMQPRRSHSPNPGASMGPG